jgi:hypothetical protein
MFHDQPRSAKGNKNKDLRKTFQPRRKGHDAAMNRGDARHAQGVHNSGAWAAHAAFTEEPSMANRTTITLTTDLARLTNSTVPPGDTLSERLSILTRRYFTLVENSTPSLSHESWQVAIETAQQIDTRHPHAHNALLGLLRVNRKDSKLAYGAEQLSPANLYAIIHVAESIASAIGPGPYTLDRIAVFLPPQKVGP